MKTLLSPVALLVAITSTLAAQPDEPIAPLLDGLGNHHHAVTTDNPRAQRFFDQGLVLAFGFNHAEAARSFREAQRLDPSCAMCYWGEALVLGPNINAAMDPEDNPDALAALKKAQALAPDASEREQAYIRALSKRYAPGVTENRTALDSAYASAMGRLAEDYPEDPDAQTLYAEALMDTTPWDYWRADGEPKAVTRTVLTKLEATLERKPDHPLANHLYIHAVEAAEPERALPSARRLAELVPGAGHLVHMPAHIYIRTGRYHEATEANQRAIAADRRYLEQVDAQGIYRLAYVPHNFHFLWATATLEGRSELAIRAAREMADMVDTELMRERGLTTLQHYWITPLYALVRFGRWDRVLDWPEPADDLVYPRAVRRYARGMALMRKGDLAAARDELARLEGLADDPRLKWVTVWDINKSRHILDIAALALRGELAVAEGDHEKAVSVLRKAVAREDALNYDEPPTWHYPTRQSLGWALLEAGKPEEAADVYKENLERFPANGWSLFGLLEALHRSGKASAARRVAQRFREAWKHADTTLVASRF